MRIKFIIPFPFDDEAIANRAAQIPRDVLSDDTEVECVPVKNSFAVDAPRVGGSYYEATILDMYVIEAGIRAEGEGYDAVIMDTASDSGMYSLRSRLTIPVIGPGLVSYAVAAMLGKKFSIITYGSEHKFLYGKILETYHLWEKCASVRAADITPDFEDLFDSEGDEEFRRLTAEAQKAIDEDGADVILLGSTTMHEAGEYMGKHLDAPVINPGPVAIKLAETLVQLRLSHSKVAFPSPSMLQDEKYFSLASAEEEVATS